MIHDVYDDDIWYIIHDTLYMIYLEYDILRILLNNS